MTSISGWLKSKAIWTIIGAIAVYLVGASLGILPDSVKNTANWFGANFTMLAVLTMFLIGAYVFHEYTKKRRAKAE